MFGKTKMILATIATTTALVFPKAYYPETGLVSSVTGDVVTITCTDGNQYEFTESDFPYWKGDIVSVLFSDNGTPEREDDEIMLTQFAGTLPDYIDLFVEAMEEAK